MTGPRFAWSGPAHDAVEPIVLLTLEKVLLALLPRAVMAVMQTTMIRASMTAYSTAVGPSSAWTNFDTDWSRPRIRVPLSRFPGGIPAPDLTLPLGLGISTVRTPDPDGTRTCGDDRRKPKEDCSRRLTIPSAAWQPRVSTGPMALRHRLATALPLSRIKKRC